MKVIKYLIFIALLSSCFTLHALTVAEIYGSKDVAILKYLDRLSIIDLNSGEEATILEATNILGHAWDKQEKNLIYLQIESIPGASYDSGSTDEARLYELSLPGCKQILLKSFTVKDPDDYDWIDNYDMYLNKEGNPVMHFNYAEAGFIGYTYNLSTKALSKPVSLQSGYAQDRFKRKLKTTITTENGAYLNISEGGVYNLGLKDGYGYDYPITNVQDLHFGAAALFEPLRYCLSPDQAYVLFSYRWNEELDLGSTYITDREGEKSILLTYNEYLGYEFVPYWNDQNELIYLENYYDFQREKPRVLKALAKDFLITTIKEWSADAPVSIRFRMR